MAQIEVNPIGPVVASANAFINAPVTTVWGVLTDFKNWPTWNKSVSRMEMKGDVKIGSTFIWVAQSVKIFSRIEELDRPNRIAWSGRIPCIRAFHVWKFEEKDEGTLVSTKEVFEGLLARISRGIIRRMLSRELEKNVIALKKEAEVWYISHR